MTADVSIRQAVVARLATDGLSDREFARQLGVSHNWVHRHLRAAPPSPFSADDLELVARALGVPMADLLPAETADSPATAGAGGRGTGASVPAGDGRQGTGPLVPGHTRTEPAGGA